MGFAILTNNNFTKNKFPLYGTINSASVLQFAYRPNGIRSFDLSGLDNNIDEKGKNTTLGFIGGQNDPCVTEFKDKTDDATFIAVVNARDLLPTANNRSWPVSCYSESPYMGIGALITADSLAGGLLDTKLRIYFGASDGLTTSRFSVPDIVINPKMNSTETPYLYIVIRVDSRTNSVECKVLNLRATQRISMQKGFKVDYKGRGGENKKAWMFGARHSGVSNTSNSTVLQFLAYGKYLTDAEIAVQYRDDQKWLKSEHGVVI